MKRAKHEEGFNKEVLDLMMFSKHEKTNMDLPFFHNDSLRNDLVVLMSCLQRCLRFFRSVSCCVSSFCLQLHLP